MLMIEKQKILFAPDLFMLVVARKKFSTIRKGLREYTLGDVALESSPGGHVILATITKLELKKLRDLRDADAEREGYSCLYELLDRLHEIYPDITENSHITVVAFQHDVGRVS